MRFEINLASHPYQDAGVFYRRWGGALFGVLVVSVALCGLAVVRWNDSKDVIRDITRMEGEMHSVNAQAAAGRAVLESSENKPTRLQAQFLNAVIARKSFSWTQAFTDLERMMPAQVHLLGLQPQFDEENRLEIQMTVGATSHEKAAALVKELEQSTQFREVLINSESNLEPSATNGTDRVKVAISALYAPRAGRAGGKEGAGL